MYDFDLIGFLICQNSNFILFLKISNKFFCLVNTVQFFIRKESCFTIINFCNSFRWYSRCKFTTSNEGNCSHLCYLNYIVVWIVYKTQSKYCVLEHSTSNNRTSCVESYLFVSGWYGQYWIVTRRRSRCSRRGTEI